MNRLGRRVGVALISGGLALSAGFGAFADGNIPKKLVFSAGGDVVGQEGWR